MNICLTVKFGHHRDHFQQATLIVIEQGNIFNDYLYFSWVVICRIAPMFSKIPILKKFSYFVYIILPIENNQRVTFIDLLPLVFRIDFIFDSHKCSSFFSFTVSVFSVIFLQITLVICNL